MDAMARANPDLRESTSADRNSKARVPTTMNREKLIWRESWRGERSVPNRYCRFDHRFDRCRDSLAVFIWQCSPPVLRTSAAGGKPPLPQSWGKPQHPQEAASETGFPSPETGCPCQETEFPCREIGYPCRGTEFPCRETGCPCQGTEFPCREIGCPCQEIGFPSPENLNPTSEIGFPSAVRGGPAGDGTGRWGILKSGIGHLKSGIWCGGAGVRCVVRRISAPPRLRARFGFGCEKEAGDKERRGKSRSATPSCYSCSTSSLKSVSKTMKFPHVRFCPGGSDCLSPAAGTGFACAAFANGCVQDWSSDGSLFQTHAARRVIPR